MKSIVISSIAAATAFVAMAVALSVWWYAFYPHRPVFKPYTAQSLEFVRNTSNIERLREFTQRLIQGNEVAGKRANQTLDTAVNVIAVLAVMCAFLSLLGMGYALKMRNQSLGIPLKWWLSWL